MDDLRAALRPLVDQPSAPPPGLDEIAARAGRRRSRRRAARGTVAALALVGVLDLAVPAVWGGGDEGVRTADAPATAPPPGATTAPERATTSAPDATPTTATPPTTGPDGTAGTGGTAATGDGPGDDPATPPGGDDADPPPGPAAPAPPTTVPPPGPTGPYDPFAGLEAESWSDASGVGAVAVDGRGGAAVTASDGSWLRFPDVRFGTGLSTAVDVVAAPGAAAGPGAVIEVRLDDVASPPFATIAVPAGGDAFVTLTGATPAIGGTHDVYVTFTSPRPGDLARVDRFVFVP